MNQTTLALITNKGKELLDQAVIDRKKVYLKYLEEPWDQLYPRH